MSELIPLNDSDRARLLRKAGRARTGLRVCAGLALAAPLAVLALVVATPTELRGATVALTAGLCLVAASPFLLKGLDLLRAVRRVDRWLQQGQKRRLTGEVTRTGPHFLITVDGVNVAAWQRSGQLSVGDVVTVEYLPLDPGLEGIVGVLRVDGEPNPYLESAWCSGPPTA